MGSGCSSDTSRVYDSSMHHRENEKNRNNPTEAFDKWQEKMLLDVGTDPLAVIRDFPRMIVYVGTSKHHNYVDNSFADTKRHHGSKSHAGKGGGGGGGEGTSKTGADADFNPLSGPSSPGRATKGPRAAASEGSDGCVFDDRVKRVHNTVMLLCELCGEETTFGPRFDASWRAHLNAQITPVPEKPAALAVRTAAASPTEFPFLDVNQLLLSACLSSGMLVMIEEGAPGTGATSVLRGASRQASTTVRPAADASRLASSCATDFDSIGGLASPPASAAARFRTAPTNVTYNVCSATFHLMQFMVQGVMFFPVQRLKHVLWMPWASHMQDMNWTIHVYLKDVSDGFLAAHRCSRVQHSEGGNGVFNRNSDGSLPAGSRRPSVEEPNHSSGKRQVIVVEHRQSGRHYVEESQLKEVPRFELDWTCSIQIDSIILTEHYASSQSILDVEPETHERRERSPLGGPKIEQGDPERHSPYAPPMQRGTTGSSVLSPLQSQMLSASPSFHDTRGGVSTSDQKLLVRSEALLATVEVVAARVEKPRRSGCGVSRKWRDRTAELAYVLSEQYKVDLDEVAELKEKKMKKIVNPR